MASHNASLLNKFILLTACLPIVNGTSFSPLAFSNRRVLRADVIRRMSASGTSEDKESSGWTTLRLRSEYSFESAPSTFSSPMKVTEFFQKPEHRNILVSGGNRLEVNIAEVKTDLFEKWKSQASLVGASEPTWDDTVLSVRTGGINFPGIKVDSLVSIGSKLLPPISSTALPAYEFVTIDDEINATGLAPVVWIFNQLTGANKKGDEPKNSPISLSRVTARFNGDGSQVTFRSEASLEVRVTFPSLLLRILPVSKEKAEEQGGESIRKALKKDIDKAITVFGDTYDVWIANQVS